ncbi:hypothetical protein [Methylobacterium iners]|uniref:hypothetical protein n=1 Tax=Methylobacterium iners TaxID=418707 RepID=UPI001EE1FB61|nr:hypothetical protein [Methylobacterium iners]
MGVMALQRALFGIALPFLMPAFVWASPVELEGPGAEEFLSSVRNDPTYTALSSSDKEVALQSAATWFVNWHCQQPVGDRNFKHLTPPQLFEQDAFGRFSQLERARIYILGVLWKLSVTGGKGSCRLAADILGTDAGR